jgi:hypothetical protein
MLRETLSYRYLGIVLCGNIELIIFGYIYEETFKRKYRVIYIRSIDFAFKLEVFKYINKEILGEY